MDLTRQRDETMENYAGRLRRLLGEAAAQHPAPPPLPETATCEQCRRTRPLKRWGRADFCVDCYPCATGRR